MLNNVNSIFLVTYHNLPCEEKRNKRWWSESSFKEKWWLVEVRKISDWSEKILLIWLIIVMGFVNFPRPINYLHQKNMKMVKKGVQYVEYFLKQQIYDALVAMLS